MFIACRIWPASLPKPFHMNVGSTGDHQAWSAACHWQCETTFGRIHVWSTYELNSKSHFIRL